MLFATIINHGHADLAYNDFRADLRRAAETVKPADPADEELTPGEWS
jgi:hypothetical protein